MMNRNNTDRKLSVRNLALTLAASAVLSAGSAMAADGTWQGGALDGNDPPMPDYSWSTPENWVGGNIPGITSGASGTTDDVATFAGSSNVQVNPDSNRQIHNIVFTSDASDYIIGPSIKANTLYIFNNITGNSANTVTFNSPIFNLKDHTVSTVAGEVFNFEGAYQSQNGQTMNLSGAGTYNFNGGLMSTNANAGRAGTNVNGSVTVNINAPTNPDVPNPSTHRVGLSISSTGTVNLNAERIIYGDPGSGGASNDAQSSLKTGGSGILNINAEGAVYGTATLQVGNATSGTTSVATINHDQDYSGRRQTGARAGLGFGTLVGNVDADTNSNTERSKPILGSDGYTVSSKTTATATLLVNNNPDNATATHSTGGSATGNSDVNIVTGLLGGNGYIVNTDVTIGSTTYFQGVTLHKRQQVTGLVTTNDYSNVTPDTLVANDLTAVGDATYGKLSPGPSAGAVGTLTMDLGSKGLNIKYAVEDDNTQTLLFDLDAPGTSDRVNLLNNTVLHIGAGGLELNDFVFTTLGGFTEGVYTLFHSSQLIDGTLGSGVLGTLGAYDVQLATANGGQDIVLLVGTAIPEPTSLSILALGALGLLARRRRTA